MKHGRIPEDEDSAVKGKVENWPSKNELRVCTLISFKEPPSEKMPSPGAAGVPGGLLSSVQCKARRKQQNWDLSSEPLDFGQRFMGQFRDTEPAAEQRRSRDEIVLFTTFSQKGSDVIRSKSRVC